METIVAVAIKVRDKVYTIPAPARHADVLEQFNIAWNVRYRTDGFMTSEDRFVNRIEAMTIARAAKQPLYDYWGDLDIETNLYSENLW